MRAGFYGAFDPWINMYKSLRYEADSKPSWLEPRYRSTAAPWTGCWFLTNRFRNSPNTVAAEYQEPLVSGYVCNNRCISRYLDAWAWAQ